MKIFQIVERMCFYDATAVHQTLLSTVGKYPPDVLFVEAPDYVFEGWGYNPAAEGDGRFVQPTPPEGWLYDTDTGTFYQEGENPPEAPDQFLDYYESLAGEIRNRVNSIDQ